jgi:hypothetical protein
MAVLRIPDIVRANDGHAAIEAIDEYFGHRDGQIPYTGAFFERLGGGGDRPAIAHEIVAEDLIAVTMLSVRVPGPRGVAHPHRST